LPSGERAISGRKKKNQQDRSLRNSFSQEFLPLGRRRKPLEGKRRNPADED